MPRSMEISTVPPARTVTSLSDQPRNYSITDGPDLPDDTQPEARPPIGQPKISTDLFRGIITTRVREICAERGWNYDNNSHRGWAFQFWVADLFCRRRELRRCRKKRAPSNDCGIDIILEDHNEKRFSFIQAKIVNYSANVDEEEISHICDRHRLFLDRDWVKKHVTQDAQFEVLGGYEDLLNKTGYSVHYCLVTTASAADRVKDVAASLQSDRNRTEPAVIFEVMDFFALKGIHIEAETLDRVSPNELNFSCRRTASRSKVSRIRHYSQW